MHPEDKLQFDEVVEGQRQLHRLLVQLDNKVELLRQRFERADRKASPAVVATTAPPGMEPVPARRMPTEPPPLPPITPLVREVPVHAPGPLPGPSAPLESAPPKPEGESLELRLGTFWLVRIGIVIFLTGLVFLGNFAYQHVIAQLGAGGKLAVLYCAGGALIGAGMWLDRTRETMQNYARVLAAGGAAAIYYTTYAAHYVESLRVIRSPIVGGALLLALAGVIVWFSERRRSETLALLAVLLAYYTSAINAIGTFTLFSSLLLTSVAVFFLVRHGWSRLSWVSLVGTYGSYAFWRFHGFVAHPASTSADFAPAFLAGYWILFAAAIFIGQSQGLRPAERMPFLTTNNAAFFALGAHHFAVHRPDWFWAFALGFGIVLLGLAALASRRFPEDRALDGACLAQGLSLLAVGLAAKLTRYQLALIFAAESVVLLSCSRWRHATLYRFGAALAALAATGLAVIEIQLGTSFALALGTTVAALLLFDAWWLSRLKGGIAPVRFDNEVAWFAALGLATAGVIIWTKAASFPSWQPAALAAAAVACAFSLRVARLPEVAILGQSFFVVGLLNFLVRYQQPSITCVPLIGAALALEQWWQRQPILSVRAESRRVLQIACAAGGAALGWWWLDHFNGGDKFMVAASAITLGTLCYALATRALGTFFVGHFFALAAFASFIVGTVSSHPDWRAALTPLLGFAVMSYVAPRFGHVAFSEIDRALPFTRIAGAYRITALILAAGWIFEYVPAEWQTPFFALVGTSLLVLGTRTGTRARVVAGALVSLLALALCWARFDLPVTTAQLAAILLIPAATRWGMRRGDARAALSRDEQRFLVGGALATTWLWVTRWTLAHGTAANLTVAWSVLALVVFFSGFALRERIYRLGGLTILGLAVARIFLIDVWQLETIYRILSFLVLGAVLLVLGFAYNRFAESLRRWL